MSLASLCPRPVLLVLAGCEFRVSQLRVRDVADLERWAAARSASPLDSLDEDAPDYAERLVAIYRNSRAGAAEFGSPVFNSLIFGTAEGRKLFLRLSLREEVVSDDRLEDLASSLDVTDWAAVDLAAIGVEPDAFADASERIDRHIGCPEFEVGAPPGQSTSWSEVVAEACLNWPWASPEVVGDLTVGQIRTIRAGGKPPKRFDQLPKDAATRNLVDEKRAAFWKAFKGKAATPAPATTNPAA